MFLNKIFGGKTFGGAILRAAIPAIGVYETIRDAVKRPKGGGASSSW